MREKYNLEFIIPENLANNKEYMALVKILFEENNLEKFLDDYEKELEKDDDPMFSIYMLSDYLNDFTHAFFSGIIQSSLEKDEYPAHLGNLMSLWNDTHKRIQHNCMKFINKLSPDEGKKKQLIIEKLEEVLLATKKIDRQTEHKLIMPGYVNKLIENGYVAPDGETAIASLDDIAEFLYTLKLDSFNFKTLLHFRQHNGRPFSENTAKEAVKRSNRV